MAFHAGAPRAADAVYVVFGHFGKFKIHDVGKPLDIEPPRGDVGRNEHADRVVFKARKRFGARRLALVAVNGRCRDAIFFKLLGKTVGGVLHAGEDEHLIPGVVDDEVSQKLALTLFGNGKCLLMNEGALLVARDFHCEGIGEEGVCKRLDLIAEGGGKQKRLALNGQKLQNLADVVDKAHVKHAVGFIKHKKPDVFKRHVFLPEVVEKSPRRGDQKIDALDKRRRLRLNVHTPENECRLQIRTGRIGTDVFVNLSGKLAGRGKHQGSYGLRCPFFRAREHLRQNRQRKGGSLAGAGLSGREHVAAL